MLLPLILLVNNLIPFDTSKLYSWLINLTFICLTFIFSQIGRDSGYKRQEYLYSLWGGVPTTLFLSHNTDYLDEITKQRYHSKLEQIVGLKFCTALEESKEPEKAQKIYDSSVKFLRDATRDKDKFQLLFTENVNYGFRRNLWGMKKISIIIILGCILIESMIIATEIVNKKQIDSKDIFLFLVYVAFLFVWLFIIRTDWVKLTAFAYAKQLVETIDRF